MEFDKHWLVIYSDMGCHIDGFIAVVGHTHVLQDGPVTGRAADVIAAANTAAEVALRLVRPGRKVNIGIPFLEIWSLLITMITVNDTITLGHIIWLGKLFNLRFFHS